MSNSPPLTIPQTGIPTPGPSSEIQPKIALLSLDSAFALPPAAITNSPPSSRKSSLVSNPKHPQSKKSLVTKRKSSTTSSAQPQEYALPPPPTRSRRIIQMKPRIQPDPEETTTTKDTTLTRKMTAPMLAPAVKSPSTSPQTTTNTAKKKSSSGSNPSTAAGRKMARKTAHSLIERRRRSKMNEEFGVLKDMIPACIGQDMHKLAILQASIEYMRYLEKCLADLKSAHATCPRLEKRDGSSMRSDTSTPMSEDTEMQEAELELPPIRQVVPLGSREKSYTKLPSISPAILPMTHRTSAQGSPYHGPAAYPYAASVGSALPSPSFTPVGRGNSGYPLHSPEVSPTVPEDHEVTAALLMLNTDRRTSSNWSSEHQYSAASSSASSVRIDSNASSSGRGFSVKDLLSN